MPAELSNDIFTFVMYPNKYYILLYYTVYIFYYILYYYVILYLY